MAYVIPAGQFERVPAEIRALPVVRDASPSTFVTGTNVIFGGGVSLYIPADPGAAIAKASRSTRRPVARAAAEDAYHCEDHYFCIYAGGNFTGRRLQWHDINSGSNWTNLGDYDFNDAASSARNRRDRDSWLAEHTGGGGDRHCYDSHSSDADFGGWANDASSTYNSAGDAGC